MRPPSVQIDKGLAQPRGIPYVHGQTYDVIDSFRHPGTTSKGEFTENFLFVNTGRYRISFR